MTFSLEHLFGRCGVGPVGEIARPTVASGPPPGDPPGDPPSGFSNTVSTSGRFDTDTKPGTGVPFITNASSIDTGFGSPFITDAFDEPEFPGLRRNF